MHIKNLNRKALVIAIILLFVGTSFVPGISGILKRNTIVGDVSENGLLHSGKIPKHFSSASMFFTENKGQYPEEVLFQTHIAGATLYMCKDKIVSVFLKSNKENSVREFKTYLDEFNYLNDKMTSQPIEMISVVLTILGANEHAQIVGEDLLPNCNNYFIGNNPQQWYTNVPNYKTITYYNIYPGIDLRYYFLNDSLKYDFVVHPGANLSQIQMRYNGINNLRITPDGDLETVFNFGNFSEKSPILYQNINGLRNEVSGRYELQQPNTFGFIVDTYNPSYSLIIDPQLVYSTYLGGTGDDVASGIAVGGSGNAYIAGRTSSSDFPVVNPYDGTYNGDGDVFVAKLSSSGNTLLYSTYLGGTGNEEVWEHIAVDGSGNAYIAGNTTSSDFPMVNPYDGTYNGGSYYGDVFVAKLSSSGNTLLYSTYLGGTGDEITDGIAVDGSGNAYIAGCTTSSDFPMVNPYDGTYNGGSYYGDVFVAKLSSSGNTLLYSTYLGGTSDEWVDGIAVDGSGNAYIAGLTASFDFPMVNPYDGTYNGGTFDAFIAKLSSSGNTLLYSTYLGGTGDDESWGIAIDGNGNAYVDGVTSSTDFPMVNPYDGTYNGGDYDAFIAKLSSSGNTLLYSTYLGGTGHDEGFGICVDSNGNAYLAGGTSSTDFPMVNPYDGTYNGGDSDVYIAKLSSSGNTLLYSTYLGGTGYDRSWNLAIDGYGNAYIPGETSSSDFPMVNPYDDTYNGGASDVFVAKYENINQPPNIPLTPSGPVKLIIGMSGIYSTNTTDLEGDSVQYRFDWDAGGSHNISSWTNLVPSGQNISMSHSWNISGSYIVKAQARDELGNVSGWSNGLTVVVRAFNLPPNSPNVTGPVNGIAPLTYDYTFVATDPESDDVFYWVDWGDGSYTSWFGPYQSGESAHASHTWETAGVYNITAKTKDIFGNESGWSEPFRVNITEVTSRFAIIIGTYNDYKEWGTNSVLKADEILFIGFRPFSLNVFSNNKPIIITVNILGEINSGFIIGLFKAYAAP